MATDRPTLPAKALAIRELLLEELAYKLPHEVPGEPLCGRTAQALGVAPLELLRTRIRARFQAITSMGMVELLAHDVRRAWELERKRAAQADAERKRIQGERTRVWEQELIDSIPRMEADLADPKTSGYHRQLTAELLEDAITLRDRPKPIPHENERPDRLDRVSESDVGPLPSDPPANSGE